MNSFRAVSLRWIFPFLFRVATVDFFGTDDPFNFVEDDFVDVPFGFDDGVDDERDDEMRPPFWADIGNGRRRAAPITAIPRRFNMTTSCCTDKQVAIIDP